MSVLLLVTSLCSVVCIPRLISDSIEGVIADMMMAFIGTFQPAGTFPRKPEPGKPSE
jgi:hypothetical protein